MIKDKINRENTLNANLDNYVEGYSNTTVATMVM